MITQDQLHEHLVLKRRLAASEAAIRSDLNEGADVEEGFHTARFIRCKNNPPYGKIAKKHLGEAMLNRILAAMKPTYHNRLKVE